MEQPSVVVSAIYFLLSVVLFGFGFYMMACEKSHMFHMHLFWYFIQGYPNYSNEILNKRLKQPTLRNHTQNRLWKYFEGESKLNTEKNAGVTKKICFNLKRFRKRTAIEGLKQRFNKKGMVLFYINLPYIWFLYDFVKACFVCLIN